MKLSDVAPEEKEQFEKVKDMVIELNLKKINGNKAQQGISFLRNRLTVLKCIQELLIQRLQSTFKTQSEISLHSLVAGKMQDRARRLSEDTDEGAGQSRPKITEIETTETQRIQLEKQQKEAVQKAREEVAQQNSVKSDRKVDAGAEAVRLTQLEKQQKEAEQKAREEAAQRKADRKAAADAQRETIRILTAENQKLAQEKLSLDQRIKQITEEMAQKHRLQEDGEAQRHIDALQKEFRKPSDALILVRKPLLPKEIVWLRNIRSELQNRKLKKVFDGRATKSQRRICVSITKL